MSLKKCSRFWINFIFIFLSMERALSDEPRAIAFYTDPKATFSSGEAAEITLKQSLISIQKHDSFLVEKDKRTFWLSRHEVATAQDLSEKQAIAITQTALRQEPHWKSPSLTNIPALTVLNIIEFQDTWVKVKYSPTTTFNNNEYESQENLGWVDLNNLILAYDFIEAVQKKSDLNWISIAYRQANFLITRDLQKIQFSEIGAIKTKPDLAISIVASERNKLSLKQHLKILKTDQETWNISDLKGHGKVYWRAHQQRQSDNTITETLTNSETLSTEQLLKREMVSFSFHPQKTDFGIASAEGIFITFDGQTWQKISRFGKKNLPVLIDHQGFIFVGTEKSKDQGKSFSPFFKWDQLALIIEQAQKKPGQHWRIQDLKSPRPGILEMQIETSAGKLRLAGRLNSGTISNWNFN